MRMTFARTVSYLAIIMIASMLCQSSVMAAVCTDAAVWSTTTGATNRWKHTSIWDPTARRMIVFGGTDGTNTLGDVRSYDPATGSWTTISTSGGPARHSHTAVYDKIAHRMIVFGGVGTGSSNPWALSLSTHTWTELQPTGTAPGAKSSHTAIFDPVNNAMIFTGGTVLQSPEETWKLALQVSPPVWVPMPTFPVDGREGMAAIYDPIGHRMVVTGGLDYTGGVVCPGNSQYYNAPDTRALSLGASPTWSTVNPYSVTPSSFSGAFYEPQCNSLVVYGGVIYVENHGGCGGPYCSGCVRLENYVGVPTVRKLNLSTGVWTDPVSTTGGPPSGRGCLGLAYDPIAKRAYVHGGWTQSETYSHPNVITTTTPYSDTWSLRMPDVTAPEAVSGLTVISCTMSSLTLWWNAPADDDGGTVTSYELRVNDTDPITDDNWSSSTVVSSPPSPAAPGTAQTMVVSGFAPCAWNYFAIKSTDASGNVSLISNSAGGRTKCSSQGACMSDGFGARPNFDELSAASLELSALAPNPAFDELSIRFVVPDVTHGRVSLGVFDLVGRRVAQVITGETRTGIQEARWNLRDANGRRVARGIYWVRLTVGDEVRNRMVVVK